MCCNPQLIINPYIIKHSDEFCNFSLNGRTMYYRRHVFDTFERVLFSPYRQGATKENYKSYYCYNSLGEVVPLYISVPCGKCNLCIKRKMNNIATRAELEQYGSEQSSYFITLTYDDKHLPDEGVNVRDIQLFLKRLRINAKRHLNLDLNLRYLFFSEYGKLRNRPHYHGLLFGVYQSDSVSYFKFEKLIRDSWKNGFIHCKLTHEQSFRYISKYLLKGSNVPAGKNPNFHVSSNRNGGLGCSALKNSEFVYKMLESTNGFITLRIDNRIKQIFVPKQIREYFFNNCIAKYDRLLRKDVSALILSSLKLNYFCEKNDLNARTVLNLVLGDDYSSDVNEALDDVVTNIVPRFVVNRFPFLSDLYKDYSVPKWMRKFIDSADYFEFANTIIKKVKKLLPIHVDLAEVVENTLILDYLKRQVVDYMEYIEMNCPDSDVDFQNCLANIQQQIDFNKPSKDCQ